MHPRFRRRRTKQVLGSENRYVVSKIRSLGLEELVDHLDDTVLGRRLGKVQFSVWVAKFS